MEKFRLNIDGMEVTGLPGQTILEVARENFIEIPTLCYDERTKIYGSCGLCVVEVEGNPKLCKACATTIAPNMVVKTNTDRVIESRKTNLELLLSNHTGDCKAPCSLACPAGTDCQGYVGLVANGEFEEANKLIKEKIPLPACIGRVCPHPCEDKCRRRFIEEPISIALIKRFAGEYDLGQKEQYIPDIAEETGKKVAVIGGGPLGLSVAFFLRQKGHDVTIFDAMSKMGGMLRYGIPEYRLPKMVIDAEVDIIERMGVHLVNNTKVSTEEDFNNIRENFDAVILGIGAWTSTGVGCPGEDAYGVLGGIDFLRKVVRNEEFPFGKKVAIVGGGNTAMDACRTAVRLGAEKVYNIYRRTKDEMPADMIEIEEAEEEGVIFKNLTNPLEIVKDEEGKVKEVVLQIMELGEPDQSGRRKPIAVEGKTEVLDVDTVILAIGQKVDSSAFDVDKTKKGGILYDEGTYMTSLPGVFAGGDCGNDKISIAIESIADANKMAVVVDGYLNGEAVTYKKPYFVKKTMTYSDFESREKILREKAEQLSPEERRDNFSEVVFDGLTEETVVKEAMRCLQCGCHDYYECKLVDYANQYDVKPDRFEGEKTKVEFVDDHPFIARDPNKCILCGLCVRICDEVMGIGALGLVNRGFDTVVKPALEKPLTSTACDCCGQCVNVCPVGAIQEKLTIEKETPFNTTKTSTTCANCSVGCSFTLETYGDMLIKMTPEKEEGTVNKGLCCAKGKWGFDAAVLNGAMSECLVKREGKWVETSYYDALVVATKKLQSAKIKYGKEAVAVAISDRYTNEEAYAMKKFADLLGVKTLCLNFRHNGLDDVLGFNASPNTIDELLSTDLIISVGYVKNQGAVIWNKMKQASENGAKVIAIKTEEANTPFAFADQVVMADNSTEFLRKIAKVLLDKGFTSSEEGFEEFRDSLKNVVPCKEAEEVATKYLEAKKAMIVIEQNVVTTEGARLVGEIASLSGHIGSARDGILLVRPKNNSQGLVDMGITKGAESLEGVKALMIFGEDPKDVDLSNIETLVVSDVYMTDTANLGDVFIPATGFQSANGTFTNTERRLLKVEPAIDEYKMLNFQIPCIMGKILEEDFGFETEDDIALEMDSVLPFYKYSYIGEVLGGALRPSKVKFFSTKEDKLVDIKTSTDNLMNLNASRIPKPFSYVDEK